MMMIEVFSILSNSFSNQIRNLSSANVIRVFNVEYDQKVTLMLKIVLFL